MKKLLLLFLITMSFVAYGQTDKSVTIWTNPMTKEHMIAHYFPDSTIIINLLGQDNRYDDFAIIANFSLFSGSPQEFYIFLTALEKFSSENVPEKNTDIDMELNGQSFTLKKMLGTTQLWIWEKDGRITYHALLPTAIPKFKEKFTQWAAENNVSYQ